MKGADNPDPLFAEYRQTTRRPAPPNLVAAVRDRLSRTNLILPRVALACLAIACLVAVTTSLSLSTRPHSQVQKPGEPPPLFQSGQGTVFGRISLSFPE